MAATNKPKVIKDFDKLPKAVKELIIATYPQGFGDKLIHYPNKNGMLVSALPFETEDTNYLVRISDEVQIVYDDIDFDDEVKVADREGKKMKDFTDITEEDNEEEFEEKYGEDVAIGPGIEDDGEDDDDEEEEILTDEDFDDLDDDIDDIDEINATEIEKKSTSKATKTTKKTTEIAEKSSKAAKKTCKKAEKEEGKPAKTTKKTCSRATKNK